MEEGVCTSILPHSRARARITNMEYTNLNLFDGLHERVLAQRGEQSVSIARKDMRIETQYAHTHTYTHGSMGIYLFLRQLYIDKRYNTGV